MFVAVALFLVALSVLVFVHELGHLLLAKWSGMQVYRFSVGFGPTLLRFQMGETTYQLALIPLGGFVDIPGVNLDEEERADEPRAFASKPVSHRVAVILAGVTMNLLFGLGLYTALALHKGVVEPTPARVMTPSAGSSSTVNRDAWSDAATGREIVRADDEPVDDFGGLASVLLGVTDGEVVLTFADGRTGRYPVPSDPEARADLVGALMPPRPAPRPARSAGDAAAAGLRQVVSTAEGAFRSGELVASGALSLRQLAGPVGMAAMSEKVLAMGWGSFLGYIAFISVTLAIMNLLPIPVLDGGYALFLLLEAVLGRPLPSRAVRLANVAGGALLVGLMLIATTSDVLRLFMM